MTPDKLAKIIKEFFLNDNPGMWEVWADGTLYNGDSNRGFKPIDLAKAIVEAQRQEEERINLREIQSSDGGRTVASTTGLFPARS